MNLRIEDKRSSITLDHDEKKISFTVLGAEKGCMIAWWTSVNQNETGVTIFHHRSYFAQAQAEEKEKIFTAWKEI